MPTTLNPQLQLEPASPILTTQAKITSGTDKVKTNYYTFRPFIRFEIPLWQSRFSIYNDLGIYGMYAKNNREGSYEYDWDVWGAGASMNREAHVPYQKQYCATGFSSATC